MKTFNRFSLILCLIVTPFQFSACKLIGPCVEGEGDVIEKSIKLSDITGVSIAGSSRLYIKQGDIQKITIKAQANIIDLLNREVKNGEWSAFFTKCIKTKETVEIFVEVPQINSLGVQGSGTILSKEYLNVGEMELEIAGSGQINVKLNAEEIESEINGSGGVNLEGKTKSIEVEINGSGDVSAAQMIAEEAEVEINGSGDVRLNVTNSMDVEINGSGDVSYKGSPKNIKTDINGSGDLNKLD